MAELIIMGSSFAVASAAADNSHLVLRADDETYLIDCAGRPVPRLKSVGVDCADLSGIIVTHFHPDHTYGLSILLMDMWLLGRKHPLKVYGYKACIDKVEALMALYDPHLWPGMFTIDYVAVAEVPNAPLFESEAFAITTTPVEHMIPCMGMRIVTKATGHVTTYSADTQPCQNVIDLAQGSDLLVHEATGEGWGHTSPRQAGEIAQQAGVKSLVLTHYDVHQPDPEAMVAEAQSAFDGEVRLAHDFMRIALE